jgi:hypothetical protein
MSTHRQFKPAESTVGTPGFLADQTRPVHIPSDIKADLERIVAASSKSANPMGSVDDLVRYTLGSLVDGFNRPGSWESEILERMGLAS